MTNLEEAVANLLAAIKDTEEYREYSMQKEKIAKFPELKAQLDDFRKRALSCRAVPTAGSFSIKSKNSSRKRKI